MMNKQKKHPLLIKLAMLTLFLIGSFVMFYPFYIDALNGYLDDVKMAAFQKKEITEYKAQQEKLEQQNKALQDSGLRIGNAPFDEVRVPVVSQAEYDRHVIGTVNLPKIALEIPLFDTTTAGLLESGATVLNGTSQPVGGKGTHAVITGHRGLPQRELFTNLPKLVRGDLIVLTVLGETLAYEIQMIQVVEPHETNALTIQEKEDLVTLVTCTPYMINSHRLLVTGHRVSYTPMIKKAVMKGKKVRKWKQIGILSGLCLLIMMSLQLAIRMVFKERLKKSRFDLAVVLGQEVNEIILYDRKGRKPLMRNGEICTVRPDERGRIVFEDLPGGMYQLKIPEVKGYLKAGIKKRGQTAKIYHQKRL